MKECANCGHAEGIHVPDCSFNGGANTICPCPEWAEPDEDADELERLGVLVERLGLTLDHPTVRWHHEEQPEGHRKSWACISLVSAAAAVALAAPAKADRTRHDYRPDPGREKLTDPGPCYFLGCGRDSWDAIHDHP